MIRAVFIAGVMGLATLVHAEATQNGTGAVLRGLDKMTDQAVDMTLKPGVSADFGHITVKLNECRYPAGNPAGDAYASLTIRDNHADKVVFEGWMVASSPALNALEHRRYDIWVLRCTTS